MCASAFAFCAACFVVAFSHCSLTTSLPALASLSTYSRFQQQLQQPLPTPLAIQLSGFLWGISSFSASLVVPLSTMIMRNHSSSRLFLFALQNASLLQKRPPAAWHREWWLFSHGKWTSDLLSSENPWNTMFHLEMEIHRKITIMHEIKTWKSIKLPLKSLSDLPSITYRNRFGGMANGKKSIKREIQRKIRISGF